MYFYLYIITNILDGKVYIGQTVNSARRWNDHKWLSKNKQEQYIHRAMNKYSIDNFIFEVIATCRTQKDVDEMEKFLISQYDSRNNEKGYNISPGGDHAWNAGLPKEQQPMYGKKQSEYQKQRMTEVHTGIKKPHSKEWSVKVSKIKMGHLTSEETKLKIAESNRGKFVSDETKIKQSNAAVGKIKSDETKSKMSKSHTGKTKSEEHKKNISLGKRHFSPEQELKIIQDRRSGLTYKQIGLKYNCSINVVFNIMIRYNEKR